MIIPLPNLFYFLSLGFVFTGISFLNKDYLLLQTILYILLLIFCSIDFVTIPKKTRIVPKRIHDKYLSIGANNLVKIKIENTTSKEVQLVIRDEYPYDFEVTNDTLKLKQKPISSSTISYYVKPMHKGEYSFNFIYIRVYGQFKLVSRQYKYNVQTQIHVYPNLIEVKKYLHLISLSRIEQLGYKKRELGGETEFDFLREYQSGDDYKRINWKATAKKRFPISQIYEKEYNRNIIVLLDSGRMMTTKYGLLTKLDSAIDASLILATASTKQKDYFSLLAFSDKIISFLPPTSKATKVLTNILSVLYNIQPVFNKTNYQLAYELIKNRFRKNSVIFIFSELYNRIVSKNLLQVLKLLAQFHKVNFISFEEIETEIKGNTFHEISRWVIQQDQILEKEVIIRDLQKYGINVIRVNANDIKQKVVNTYLST